MPPYKTIKRAEDMLRFQTHLHKAKIGYPNRFLNEAQVRPVSGGRTIASVRGEMIKQSFSISRLSGDDFYSRHRLPPARTICNIYRCENSSEILCMYSLKMWIQSFSLATPFTISRARALHVGAPQDPQSSPGNFLQSSST